MAPSMHPEVNIVLNMDPEVKQGGFGSCHHREEIPFQLSSLALFGQEGTQAGRKQELSDAAVSQPLCASVHLPCCQEKWFPSLPSHCFPPYSGTICDHTAEQIEERPQAEFYRVFLTWNSSLMPFIT